MRHVQLALFATAALALVVTGPHLLDELARRRDPLAPSDTPRPGVVLCVGDSASFGIAVPSDAGWTSRIDRDGTTVISRAAPRLHSEDALRELSQWLAEVHPATVVLSVGADDAVITPAPLLECERRRIDGGSPRPWFPPLARAPRAEEDRKLLFGAWRSGPTRLQFDPDGQFRLGDRSMPWHSEGPRLYVELEPGKVAELRWFRHRDTLDLDGPILGGPMSFRPEDDDPDPRARARRALRDGLFLLARVRLEQVTAVGIADDLVLALGRDLDVVEGRAEGPIPAEFHAHSLSAEQSTARDRAIRASITLAHAFGARVILVGHGGALGTLDDTDAEIARSTGSGFVRLAGVLSATELFDDTALPTAAGHARIAGLVRAAL